MSYELGVLFRQPLCLIETADDAVSQMKVVEVRQGNAPHNTHNS
jgi:hypothetical protein